MKDTVEQPSDPAGVTVSYDDEPLVLVDEQDREIGFLDKRRCHDGEGVLHRAFSVFVFDDRGRVLLQQRAPGKRLWPMYWSNSCCSHPRRGEGVEAAVVRRLHEELGLRVDVQYRFKFRYYASFGSTGAEHELCWVYTGVTSDQVRPNASEINAVRWVEAAELDAEMAHHPERFTPWSVIEWRDIRHHYHPATHPQE